MIICQQQPHLKEPPARTWQPKGRSYRICGDSSGYALGLFKFPDHPTELGQKETEHNLICKQRRRRTQSSHTDWVFRVGLEPGLQQSYRSGLTSAQVTKQGLGVDSLSSLSPRTLDILPQQESQFSPEMHILTTWVLSKSFSVLAKEKSCVSKLWLRARGRDSRKLRWIFFVEPMSIRTGVERG